MYVLNINKKQYTEKELFKNLKRVWDNKQSQPNFRDMNKTPSTICAATYINRFGSWNNALLEFIKSENGTVQESKLNFSKNKREKVNLSTRYNILKRDNYRCAVCGSSPSNNTCKRLEIDHIKPVSRDGSNISSNLRTLCEKCNSGKHDKM